MPSPSKTEQDGRSEEEKKCTKFACAFEHCFQQHKYQMAPPCVARLQEYQDCVKEEKLRQLHLTHHGATRKPEDEVTLKTPAKSSSSSSS